MEFPYHSLCLDKGLEPHQALLELGIFLPR